MTNDSAAKALTSNTAFYYCCYMLSTMGWDVKPSSAAPRSRTIRARKAGDEVVIKVKAVSGRYAAGFGSTIEGLPFDYVVVLNTSKPSQPKGYVLAIEKVRSLMKQNVKDGLSSFWLEIKDYESGVFEDGWERIKPR